MTILVFAENTNNLIELCRGARQLGDRVEAVVIGGVIGDFADKVWEITPQHQMMLEDYTETLAALVEKTKPGFLLIEPTKRCKLIAGRLAAILGASVITDVSELTKDGEAKHMVYGGAAIRKEKAATATAIVTVGSGVFEEATPITVESVIETLEFVEPTNRIKVVGKVQKPKVSADLNKAKRIVGIGRGLAKEEDLELIQNLAAVVGAEVGCSRPIAEGEGWMPKENYIGITGLMLSPDLYFAIGISGQIQHVVGMNQSKIVVAVNKDKNAPIFKYADYGIVGDPYKVVPSLVEHFSKLSV